MIGLSEEKTQKLELPTPFTITPNRSLKKCLVWQTLFITPRWQAVKARKETLCYQNLSQLNKFKWKKYLIVVGFITLMHISWVTMGEL